MNFGVHARDMASTILVKSQMGMRNTLLETERKTILIIKWKNCVMVFCEG